MTLESFLYLTLLVTGSGINVNEHVIIEVIVSIMVGVICRVILKGGHENFGGDHKANPRKQIFWKKSAIL